MARAGEAPEVVLEAAYGWYWAADTLAELGATVHLAHPLGVKMFSYRRVKNDQRDAADLADLLRMGRLPEAWIAPPATRELRGWVRHRAKLVGLRSSLKCQVHAVLAARGRLGADERPVRRGRAATVGRTVSWGTGCRSSPAPGSTPLLRVITALEFEIELFTKLVNGRLRTDPGYRTIQPIPGVGPVLAAVFVAEIGDIGRFHRPEQLASLGGADPETPRVRHHRAPRPDHETGFAVGALGGGRGRATRRRPYPPGATPGSGRRPPWPQHRRRGRRPGTAHPGLLRAA